MRSVRCPAANVGLGEDRRTEHVNGVVADIRAKPVVAVECDFVRASRWKLNIRQDFHGDIIQVIDRNHAVARNSRNQHVVREVTRRLRRASRITLLVIDDRGFRIVSAGRGRQARYIRHVWTDVPVQLSLCPGDCGWQVLAQVSLVHLEFETGFGGIDRGNSKRCGH